MGIKFDVAELLEPYKEGGSEISPVERSISTIASKLIIAYRLPPDAVGAAMFKVFYKMAYEGLEFKGNNKYGSKGSELFSCIKAQAIDITKRQVTESAVQGILKTTTCFNKSCNMRILSLFKQTRFRRVVNYINKPIGRFWSVLCPCIVALILFLLYRLDFGQKLMDLVKKAILQI